MMNGDIEKGGIIDRLPTLLSPEGKIILVEYARQASKSGSTAIGISAKDGVAIIADKKIPHKLIIEDSIEKVMKIDDQLLGTFSGWVSDGRILLDFSREWSQRYKLIYGGTADMELLVREISDIMEYSTRFSGLRPFAVSLIFAGIDRNEPKVFSIDPSGIFFRYKAVVIGEFEDKLMNILEERYKDNITVDDAIRLGIELLREVLKDNFSYDRLSVGYVRLKEEAVILNGNKIKEIYES